MADTKHLEILEIGVKAWNIWYKVEYRGCADLRGANLRCVDLSGINLTGARLQGADLRYADLSGADLRGVSLHDAKLERCVLRGARLGDAQGLTETQLYYADGDESTELPKGLAGPAHWQDLEAIRSSGVSIASGALAG